MQLSIRSRDVEIDDDIRDLVERRTRFALDAFKDRVESVAVYFMDLNGPKGGVDKICQMAVRVRGVGELIVLERGPRLTQTLNRAARRLKYRVSEGVRRAVRPASESIRTNAALA
jgi:putative sigma-54 modulation protein